MRIVLGLTVLLAFAAPAHASGCLTPQAPHEPLCNPFAASDWAISHRNSYEQDSTPYAGPVTPDQVKLQSLPLESGTLPFLQFTKPYPDGKQVAWYSEAGQPDATRIGKVDVATGTRIDEYSVQGTSLGTISGVYTMLDHAGHFIVGKGQTLTAYADAQHDVRTAKIVIAKQLTLPRGALCADDDRLVGIVPTWDGSIAFATADGMTGVLPDRLSGWTPAKVHAVALGTCRETVSNSIAADEHGGIYVVTSGAQYRINWCRHKLRVAWRVPYKSDGYQGGIRVGTGSGSSPTVMGTAKRDDKLVVITDGQQVMHYLAMWRDRIPHGWTPPPGDPRRVACDVRLDFGNPQIAKAQSEQSVAVRGYGAVMVNNALTDTTAFDSLPQSLHYTAAVLASGEPGLAAHGMERVDWDPKTRTCKVRWTNSSVSIPNAIPTVSGGSDTVYAIGVRDGTWGLEGVNFSDGSSRLWVPSGVDQSHNSVYADSELAPDGTVWTGTEGAIDIYRTLHRNPALPLRCVRRAYTRCQSRKSSATS